MSSSTLKKILKVVLVLAAPLAMMQYAKSQKKSPPGKNPCVEDKRLYEPMLIPTRNDTLEFERIKNNYTDCNLGKGFFRYSSIPLVRGLIDTARLSNRSFNTLTGKGKPNALSFLESPLIVEGKVVRIFPDDSLMRPNVFFKTDIVIEIKAVLKSRYTKIKPGDYVVAKTDLYGYFYDKQHGEVGHTWTSEVGEYQLNNTYLFVLNKYFYMSTCYKIMKDREKGVNTSIDEYCPYSFRIDIPAAKLSEDYATGKLSKQDIFTIISN